MEWLIRQLRQGANPRTYVLVGLLAAVLVWIHSVDERQKELRGRAQAASAPAAAVAAVPAPGARRAAFEAVGPGWGRDPFERRFSAAGDEGTARAAQRTPGRSAGSTGLYLQGVMSGPLGRTALINGTVCREGERLGTREVLQIGRRSVLLLDQGTVVTLYLQGEGR
ncbi:MAG TPA: hypothetical protein VID50_00730 [Candidatus Eisenbacteria bacterium]